MLIETETTPNPSTLKFLPGQEIMNSGTRDFADPEEASASPLAEALFSLGDVTGVFFGRDFISVTAGAGTNWADLKPEVLSILLDHFSGQMPLFHPASAAGFSVPVTEELPLDDPAAIGREVRVELAGERDRRVVEVRPRDQHARGRDFGTEVRQ